MDSETVEIRAISRGVAVVGAVVVGALLATVELPATPAPGSDGDFSIEIVRKRTEAAATAVANVMAPAADAATPAAAAKPENGVGADVRLWLNDPAGDIVFVNAERYARCVAARARRVEDADCPSAGDRRRMVLDRGRA